MDKLFVMVIVLMLIFILSMFLFVYFTSTGVEKNAGDLKTELEKAQVPRFSPMGIVVEFMEFFLSLFR